MLPRVGLMPCARLIRCLMLAGSAICFRATASVTHAAPDEVEFGAKLVREGSIHYVFGEPMLLEMTIANRAHEPRRLRTPKFDEFVYQVKHVHPHLRHTMEETGDGRVRDKAFEPGGAFELKLLTSGGKAVRERQRGPITEGRTMVIHAPVFAPGEKRCVEVDLNRLFESQQTPDDRFLPPDHYVLEVKHHTQQKPREIRFAVVLPDTKLMLNYLGRKKPRHDRVIQELEMRAQSLEEFGDGFTGFMASLELAKDYFREQYNWSPRDPNLPKMLAECERHLERAEKALRASYPAVFRADIARLRRDIRERKAANPGMERARGD